MAYRNSFGIVLRYGAQLMIKVAFLSDVIISVLS